MADASYPDDLKYHAEHDWARIDGDVATLGITWYAQDQLGENHYLTVTNAANHEKDLAWFRKQAQSFDVSLKDALHDYAMLAVQGP